MANYPGTIFSDTRTLPVFLVNVNDVLLVGSSDPAIPNKRMTVINVEDNGAPTIFITIKPENGAVAYRVELEQDTPVEVFYA